MTRKTSRIHKTPAAALAALHDVLPASTPRVDEP